MLVPGSAGYDDLLQLLSEPDREQGITAGVATFTTALSIAYGLMVSVVIAPRRLG